LIIVDVEMYLYTSQHFFINNLKQNLRNFFN